MAFATEYVYGTFYLPPRQRRPPDEIATGHPMPCSMGPPHSMLSIRRHIPGRQHKIRMPEHGGPPIRSGIPDMGPSESEYLCVCMPPHEHVWNKNELGPIPPGLDSIRRKQRLSPGHENHPTFSQNTTQGRKEEGPKPWRCRQMENKLSCGSREGKRL